ncbi:MAG: ankyrin repeat domain-containing protein [Pseudomonadota bacterium]
MMSLDKLRRTAKALKKAYRAGDDAAVARVGAALGDTSIFKHADALHVVAKEAGFPSWPRLKFAAEMQAMDRAGRADRLKIALYLGQDWIVEALLAAEPDLGSENFGLQCALYDVEAVRRVLERDPTAATRAVGVRSPILHLTYSKHFRAAPERAGAMIAVAEALVDAGADVNDSYPFEPDSPHEISALYGALGHAGNLQLAEWLLDHGATPDDDESLYHATELPTLDGVKLLMRYGVKTAGTNVLLRMLDFDNFEGVRLLLDYGADPNEEVPDHPSGQAIPKIPALHHAARRGRDGRFVELLLQHGADGNAIWEGRTAYAVSMLYGNLPFARALAERGYTSPLNEVEAVLAACAEGRAPDGQPLAHMDLSAEERLILTRVILWEEALDHAKALVAAGIDPNVADEMNMTPLHLAAWAGLPEQTAWLLTLSPDLSHVNSYGGDLIGTIIHGSENRLDTEVRDHVACARLAFDAGARLRQADLDGAMDETMVAFLTDWAEAHPDRIVARAQD